MAVTVLAIVFLGILVTVAIAGSRFLANRSATPGEANREKCSICRRSFEKSELIMREIGDYKLLYFCRECISKLHADSEIRN